MKKSISAILSVLLVLVLALTLFACGKTGNTDETTGDGDMQTTEEVMTEYDVTKDAFELSLYTDSSSASYRALGDPVQILRPEARFIRTTGYALSRMLTESSSRS